MDKIIKAGLASGIYRDGFLVKMLETYGIIFSTGAVKLYLLILFASVLAAAILNAYLVPLFSPVILQPLEFEKSLLYHSSLFPGAGTGVNNQYSL